MGTSLLLQTYSRTFEIFKKENTGQIIGGAIAQSAPMLSGP